MQLCNYWPKGLPSFGPLAPPPSIYTHRERKREMLTSKMRTKMLTCTTCTCNKLLKGYLKHQIWEDYVYEHAIKRMSNKLFEMKILFIPKCLPVEKIFRLSTIMSYDRILPHSWLSSCLCYYFTMFRLA